MPLKKKTKMLPLLVSMLLMGTLLLTFPLTASAKAELPDDEPIELPDEYYTQPEPEYREPNPFTPDGTGTVIDNATDEDGKEFFTIETPDGNVFFLVIDKQRTGNNVYFLNAVTEEDLMSLAKTSAEETTVTVEEPVVPPAIISDEGIPEPEPANEIAPVPETTNNGSSNVTLIVVIVVAVIGAGGAGYYFKILRPKSEGVDDDDYGEDFGDDDDDNSYDETDDTDDETGEDGEPQDDGNENEDDADTDTYDGDAPADADGHSADGFAQQYPDSGTSPPYTGNQHTRRRKKRRRPNYNGQ